MAMWVYKNSIWKTISKNLLYPAVQGNIRYHHADHIKKEHPNTMIVTECFIYQYVCVSIQEPTGRELLTQLGLVPTFDTPVH